MTAIAGRWGLIRLVRLIGFLRARLQLLRCQLARALAVELVEQGTRRCGIFVEVDAAVLLEVYQRRRSGRIPCPALLIDHPDFPVVEAAIVVDVDLIEVAMETRLHLRAGQCAVWRRVGKKHRGRGMFRRLGRRTRPRRLAGTPDQTQRQNGDGNPRRPFSHKELRQQARCAVKPFRTGKRQTRRRPTF